METVSERDTDAASNSRHKNTCSHSTWPLLSGSSSQSFDQPLETNNPSAGITAAADAVSQRRRVNPDTLAVKLGPDLVRDLEALIQPGIIEMPSYAVRKKLQERYSIDRRHIYDYFHSRGLRVIKEDKNGNAIVPKDLTPALASPKPNLRVRISCRASTKEPPRVNTANLVSKRKEARPPVGSKPCGVTKAKSGRQRKHARSTQDDPPPPAAVCPSSRTVQPISPLPQHFGTTNKNHEFDPATSFLEEFNPFVQAMDTSDMHGGTPVFETSPVLHNLSRATPDLRGDATRLDSSPHMTFADPLSPNFYTLSATEQLALYPLLSGAFDTRDTQECTGTYKAYMQERSRLYYEELLAVPYERSRNERKSAPSGDHETVSCNDSDFRRWVNPGEPCVLDEKIILSKKKPCKGTASTIRQKTSPGLSYGTDNEAQPLDILFPILDQKRTSVNDLGESPVVRTQCQSYIPLDFCFLLNAEDGDVEDHLLDPSSGAGIFPECSAPLRSKIRGQSLHGHPDFPRSPLLLPPAELRHADVNPKGSTPLQQPTSSLTVHEMGAFTLKQKNSRNNIATQTRFAPCTPPKSQLRDYDGIRMRSFTSHSARRRTTSAGGGI